MLLYCTLCRSWFVVPYPTLFPFFLINVCCYFLFFRACSWGRRGGLCKRDNESNPSLGSYSIHDSKKTKKKKFEPYKPRYSPLVATAESRSANSLRNSMAKPWERSPARNVNKTTREIVPIKTGCWQQLPCVDRYAQSFSCSTWRGLQLTAARVRPVQPVVVCN